MEDSSTKPRGSARFARRAHGGRSRGRSSSASSSTSTSRTTEYGTYPIVTLRNDAGDGEYAVHGFHTVLKNELAKRPPRIGERLGIKYLGQRTSGDTRRTGSSTRRRAAVDRDKIGAEGSGGSGVD